MKNRQSLKSALSIVMALAGASVASAVGFIVLHRGDILNATVYQPVATASTTSGAASVANTASQNSLVNAPLGVENSIDDSSGSSNNPSQGTVGNSTATASSNSTESSSISDTGNFSQVGSGNSSTTASSAQNASASQVQSSDSGGPAGPPPPQPGDKITAVTANAVSPDYLNQSVPIYVEVYNKLGAKLPLDGHHVTYQMVSGPSGAKVSSDGHFTATAPGTYVLNVSVDGMEGNEVTIVEQDALQMRVSVSNQTLAGPGQSAQVVAHVTSGQFHDVQGIKVHFFVPPGSPVKLSSSDATTDVNGLAAVNVVALDGVSAPVSVAITGSMEYGVTESTSVTVTKASPPAKLVPSEVPNYVTKDGAFVDFTVEDENGNTLEGVKLVSSATGGTTKVMDNGFGTYWVYIGPNTDATTVHLDVTVSGTSLSWSGDFPVRKQ